MSDSANAEKRGRRRVAKNADGLTGNDHASAPDFSPESFQKALLGWYDVQRRDLPWRAKPGERSDPYRVWLSEIMLQQTTVKAVAPYFKSFLARWPTVQALAAAPRDDVLAAWAGLGYYSRARNLHACARVIAETGFPATEAGLRKLPGVGPYTAGAIAAIAFGEPVAAVDGNVERVLSRVFALETALPAAKPMIRQLAAKLTPAARPGDYAQAVMDLGATICTPRSPSCLVCAVRAFCAAAAKGEAERFPLKAAKPERPIRRGNAYVIVASRQGKPHILLRQRPDNGLLGGMMEVPCTEWVTDLHAGTTAASSRRQGKSGGESRLSFPALNQALLREARAVRHTFTHFHLELSVFAGTDTVLADAADKFDGEWAPLSDLANYALPTVMRKIISSGLAALNASGGSGQETGNASSSASSVATVEASARPSTRAGRKWR
jgi:A/G-specific adenine glycosylase